MKNVSIIGATLSGNKGAAAMLQSVLENLPPLVEQVHFDVLSVYPEQDELLNDDERVQIVPAKPLALLLAVPLAMVWVVLRWLRLPPRLLRRVPLLLALERSDLLIDLSGISFSDGRVVELVYNVVCILPALLLGKKIMKYSQAMGPFETTLNRWAARTLLPRMSVNVARGQRTLAHLQALGLENVALCADAAFLIHERQAPQTGAALLALKRSDGRQIVGISASSVVHAYCERRDVDYPAILADFANRVIEEGYSVWLIAHAVRKSRQGGRTDDTHTCQAVYDALRDKQHCRLIVEDHAPETLRAIIGECDFFVASRFHAMVSSLARGVPTIVTGWSHKYVEVLEMFELEEWIIGYRELSAAILWDTFRKLVAKQDEIKAKIAHRQAEVVASSRRNASLAAELLNR